MFKFKNNKNKGFSLIELIVVIAIMAVIAMVLVPALLSYVEESRAGKDTKTTDELVSSVELALSDQDIYDELLEHVVEDNISCYVDKINEADCADRQTIKEAGNFSEWYEFGDDARQLDETPYFGAGNMRGVTITFSPIKSSNESEYILKDGVINKFVGRNTGYVHENEKIYNAMRSVIGDTMKNSSQTYRNSDFTIFIRMGTTGGNEAANQDAVKVYGQFNGTNLTANDSNSYKLTADRLTGSDGLVDFALNEKNNASKGQPDFSETAFMGSGVTTSTGTGNVVQKAPENLTNTAIAFYCEDDASLNLTRINEEVNVGDVINGKTATAIYYGIESESANWALADIPWAQYQEQIKSVKTLDWIQPIYTTYWFAMLKNCNSFDLSKMDTSKTIGMLGMFGYAGYNCKEFTLNLSGFSADNLKTTKNMFYDTGYNSEKVYINLFETSSVTDMTNMFRETGYNSNSFKIKNLDQWDVSNATTLQSLFYLAGYNAKEYSIGDLSNWNTQNVTHMGWTFYYSGYSADNWYVGNLSNWNTSKVTNMKSMFLSSGFLSPTWNVGDLSNWDTSKVTDMSYMFKDAGSSSKSFNIGNIGKWDVGNVTTMYSMFYSGCPHSSDPTVNQINNHENWNIGDLSNWNVSKVTDMTAMFYNAGYNAKTFNIGNIGNWNMSNVTSIAHMFMDAARNSENVYIGDLSNWQTGNITSMYSAFNRLGYNTTNWSIGDLSKWNVSKVEYMCWTFQQTGGKDTSPYSLGDLSNWNLQSCINANAMFHEAGKEAQSFFIGDISKWNTAKITDMRNMFRNTGLNSDYRLDLSGWNVDAVGLIEKDNQYGYIGFNEFVEDKVIAPSWKN